MSWQNIIYFEPAEFACKCGECGSDGTEMALDFVETLDDLRGRLGFPLVVTSGYRCPEYNSRIASTGLDGPHTTGRAVDIKLAGPNVHRLVMQVSLGGWMSGIGLNQRGDHAGRFVHLDDLTEPDHHRPRVWTY
jgi:zinc D-Ala-D-Ala carboxypeptidase